MAYRWLGVMLLAAACGAGCADAGTGGPRGDAGVGGTGGDGGGGGTAGAGGLGGGGGTVVPCTTSVLCRSCPTNGSCESNDDCSVGSVCIESGCDSLEGAPLKECVFAGGGACTSNAMCSSGRQCMDVPGEGKRCVKTTPGCDSGFDCVLGFTCENGSCVDRRVPCDVDADCPKNHLCGGTAKSTFCLRIQTDCLFEFDCVDRAPHCVDVDGDGKNECAGALNPNDPGSNVCVNADCVDSNPSAPVCEASGASSATQCGQYGLCLDDPDCAPGFTCQGLWPDGRKECVPGGGDCSSFTDCPVRTVCASARDGGAPSCQAGFQP